MPKREESVTTTTFHSDPSKSVTTTTFHSDPSKLASSIAGLPARRTNESPLWAGPCAPGPLGGITQSMIVRFLSCRERFRLKYLLGLEPPDKWNHKIGYGNLWHTCEEALAADIDPLLKLRMYAAKQCKRYPLQREEIVKWTNICGLQFVEYAKYWANHPDVLGRTALAQEQVFDVPYTLPSGRVVRLRGKYDSIDLITYELGKAETPPILGGVYIQENKTKGDIDKERVERQLKFDLQSMFYLTALHNQPSCDLPRLGYYRHTNGREYPILGVRYNVVRRPLSGGRGNISPHKAKYTKTKTVPAETSDQFYERLRRDYIAAEPEYWFFRIRAEISLKDVEHFQQTCLNSLLEHICWWYDEVTGIGPSVVSMQSPPTHYRTPFGVYSTLEEGGATEYDAYLATGSEAGLQRTEELFTELKE